MSFEDRWRMLVEKNPKLTDDEAKMTMSVAAFRFQLRRMYNAGCMAENKVPDLKKAADDFASVKQQKNPLEGIFDNLDSLGDLFGGKK